MSVQLGAYAFETRLGRGGMGDVFAGRHTSSGHDVALKIMRAERAFGARRRAFRVEVEAIARLDHPGVVCIHDHGELARDLHIDDQVFALGTPYLIMDRVPGRTLRDHGRVSWSTLEPILRRILAALATAHARGVLHRDLKPDNILLHDGAPVLIDFGVATLRGAATAYGGTLAYMAPEQLTPHAHGEGPWTDLYALATLAHECWTGMLPYPGATQEALLEARRQGLRTPWPEDATSQSARTWIDACLAPEPALRFSCAAEALDALHTPAQPTRAPTSASLSTLFSLTTDFSDVPVSAAPTDPLVVAPQKRRLAIPALEQTLAISTQPLSGAGLGLVGVRVPAMLGRDEEREHLWSALRGLGGEGVALAYEGFAGVGKSRLLRWLCHSAHARAGVPHLWVSWEEGLDPRTAWARAWDDALGLAEGARRDEVQGRAISRLGLSVSSSRTFAEILRPAERAVSSDALAARVLSEALAALATSGPAILVLDDLHLHTGPMWWLEDVGALMARTPLLVAMTAREESMQEEPGRRARWQEALASLGAQPHVVAPLEASAHRDLVSSVLSLRPDVADRVISLTRGNPLHTLQLLGDWIEQELVTHVDGGFAPREDVDFAVPSSIEEVCRVRVDNVTREDAALSEVLEHAALLGVSLRWREWEALAEAQAEPWLGLLTRAGLAERTRQGWRFVHGLLRESLEVRCRDAGRWGRAHAACVDVLAPEEEESAPISRRVCHHAIESEQWFRAVDAWYSAQFDMPYEQARVELAGLRERLPVALAPEVEALLLLCDAKTATHAGRLDPARAVLTRAASLVAPGTQMFRRIMLSTAEMHLFAFELEEGLAILDDLEDTPAEKTLTWLLIHSLRGQLYQYAHRFDEAIVSNQAALDIARQRHPWHISWTSYLLASSLSDLGRWDEAFPYLEESERRFEDLADLVGTGSAALIRADHAMLLGDHEAVIRWQTRALEMFEIVGDAGASIALENLTRTNLQLARFDRARAHRDALVANIERGEAFETFYKDIDMGLALADGDLDTFDALADTFSDEDSTDMWAREDIALCLWHMARDARRRGLLSRTQVLLELLSRIRAELDLFQGLDLEEVDRFTSTLSTELA